MARPPNRPLRPVARLLVDAVNRCGDAGLPADVAGLDVAAVIEAGGLHRVTPAIEQLVRGWPDPPPQWPAPLAAIKHMQMMRHLRAVHDLRAIAVALDGAGISWVVVKGPVLAETVWPTVAMREYFDLDIIVDRRRFADALEAISAAGAELLDRNWPMLRDTMRAELAMTARYGTPLDLHWHIAVTRELRSAFPFDVHDMLDRARPVRLGENLQVPTFDPIDTALHVAFHAAQAGANRLVWLADLRFTLADPGFDWPEFERRARRAHAFRPVAIVADRTRRVIGLPPPLDEKVARLPLGVWGRLASWRDTRHPFPGLPNDRRLGGNLYSAAREGLVGSMARLIRNNMSSRREGRRHDSGRSPGRVLRRDIPDAGARRDYLRRTHNVDRP